VLLKGVLLLWTRLLLLLLQQQPLS